MHVQTQAHTHIQLSNVPTLSDCKFIAVAVCRFDKGFIRSPDGKCVCPSGAALNENGECIYCPIEKGLKIDERGRCVCALERGLIIDERGNCICPVEFGYRLDVRGNCKPVTPVTGCDNDDQCADHKYCNPISKTCEDACAKKQCGTHAFCNATNHMPICQCIAGYSGNPDEYCSRFLSPSDLEHNIYTCLFLDNTHMFRTDFPRPEMQVSCLSDGVQVQIHIHERGFNGVLYVKGHSKDEQCRRVITLTPDSAPRTELFKIQFGNCGLIHVNVSAKVTPAELYPFFL